MVRLRRPGGALARDAGPAITLKMPLRYGENPHQQAALYLPVGPPRTASPRPNRSRARSSATTISTMPMPRSSWSPNSATARRRGDRQARQPLRRRDTRDACWTRGTRRWPATASRRSAGSSPPTARSTPRPPKRSPASSPRSWSPRTPTRTRAIFARKKNLRLLLTGELPDPARGGQTVAVIAGGMLVQDRDNGMVTRDQLKCVTKRQPTEQELADCLFAWTVAKHVKSNAIVYAKDGVTAGIGAGQMNRRDSARIAALQGQGSGGSQRLAGAAHGRFGGRVGRLLPLRRRFARRRRSRRDGGDPARRLDPRRRSDRRRRRGGLAMLFTGMRHFRHWRSDISSLIWSRASAAPRRRAARWTSLLPSREQLAVLGPEALDPQHREEATRIAGTPRPAGTFAAAEQPHGAPTATPAAVAQTRSQRQPETGAPSSCASSRDLTIEAKPSATHSAIAGPVAWNVGGRPLALHDQDQRRRKPRLDRQHDQADDHVAVARNVDQRRFADDRRSGDHFGGEQERRASQCRR